MAVLNYTKTTWNDGNVPPINANNLNNIETGVEAASNKINEISVATESKQDKKTAVTHSESTAVGDATKGVYINANGQAIACTYVLQQDVTTESKLTDHIYENATSTKDGLMTAANFNKLAGIPADATHVTSTEIQNWGYRSTTFTASDKGLVPASGSTSNDDETRYLKATGEWATPPNTTYNVATPSAPGLMGANDKAKLDGVAEGATANVGTVKGVIINGTAKTELDANYCVNIGTVLTEHQSLAGYAKTSDLQGYAKTSDLAEYAKSADVQTQIYEYVSTEAAERISADNALQTAINGKQNTLIAGENITIEGDVISAAGGGGGGFPTTADPGDAMVYNGNRWARQDGYGYTEPAKNIVIEWDGNTTEKEYFEFFDMQYYKVDDTAYSDFIGITNGTGIITSVEGSGTPETLNYSFEETDIVTFADLVPLIGATVVSGDATLLKLPFNSTYELPFVMFSQVEQQLILDRSGSQSTFNLKPGVYFVYMAYDDTKIYTSKVSYTTAPKIHKIDSKYLDSSGLPSGTEASQSLIWNGSEWQKQSGYGYETIQVVASDVAVEFTDTRWVDVENTAIANLLNDGNNVGRAAIVTYDGIDYERIIKSDNGRLYIGNGNLEYGRLPDTGDPFVLWNWNSSSTTEFAIAESEALTAHTFTVKVETITTIDNKFIKHGDVLADAVKNDGIGYGGITTFVNDRTILGRPEVSTVLGSTESPTDVTFYKVSDDVLPSLSASDIASTTFTCVQGSDYTTYDVPYANYYTVQPASSANGDVYKGCSIYISNGNYCCMMVSITAAAAGQSIRIRPSDEAPLAPNAVTFPSAGTWLMSDLAYISSNTVHDVNGAPSTYAANWKIANRNYINKINKVYLPEMYAPVLSISSSQISSGIITFTAAQKIILENDSNTIIALSGNDSLGSAVQYLKRETVNASANTIVFTGFQDTSSSFGSNQIGVLTYDSSSGTGVYSYNFLVPSYQESTDIGKVLGVTDNGLSWVPKTQSSKSDKTPKNNDITSSSISYMTTAPTADNIDGLKIVVLDSAPAIKYNGYLYIITGS